jgi:hypothetical protein
LESIDDNIQPYDAGIQARSLGISLYAPNFSEEETPDALVEGVLIADRQYFEKQDAMLRAAGLL